MSEPLLCSLSASEAGEPLVGSGTSGMTWWLLVESTEPWPAKGLPDRMDPALRGRLEAARAATPETRLLLIRRDCPTREGHRRILVIRSTGRLESARAHWISSHGDPGPLDIPALASSGEPVAEPIVLVCTHGQRDTCCARFGMPVFQALADRAPAQVWRASHLGGHRFAPTAIVLPAGLHYGRLTCDDADALLESAAERRILPERYRGRTWASSPAQAALCSVRSHLGAWGVDDVTVDGEEADGDDVVVTLGTATGAMVARVRKRPLPAPLVKSCGQGPVAVSRWVVVD